MLIHKIAISACALIFPVVSRRRRNAGTEFTTMMMTRKSFSVVLAVAAIIPFTSCASLGSVSKKKPAQTEWNVSSIQHGEASWYGIRCNGGTHTASGETLCNHAATAAHKTLPMGTKVRVINLTNGKSEIVKINDRGPYIKGRVIDVTEGVAQRLGFYKRGIVNVKVEVLEKPDQG